MKSRLEIFFTSILAGFITIVSSLGNANENCSVVSPPLIHIRYDWHAITFFAHPSPYDAIELLVIQREGGEDLAHVILTRTDGTQIQVSTEPLFGNEISVSPIEFLIDHASGLTTWSTDMPEIGNVSVKISADGAPAKRFGGLTNPGNHGVTTMVPLMYREKTGLSLETEVLINGSRHDIESESLDGSYTRPRTYLTEGWHSALLYRLDDADRAMITPPVADAIMSIELLPINLSPTGCSSFQARFIVTPKNKTSGFFVFELQDVNAQIEGTVQKSTVDGARVSRSLQINHIGLKIVFFI